MAKEYIEKDKYTFPIENIFEIDQPDKYICLISDFQLSLARLSISIAQKIGFQEIYKIVFRDVRYIDCPVRWTGARFDMASPGTCIDVVKRFETIQNLEEKEILDSLSLYTVSNPGHQIQILAHSGTLSKL